ncbi:hypothetical protein C5E45_15755 [Nocardia nova]|uniref:Tetracycline repressor TetR C-terminal domain-containing protein n=2 Tax=Nocardia nova TaxID=37330 RepID=A0A2S6APM3_9NOCA|nr:hypothetical protein C5E41_15090 [Nocardia nova]PPJ37126.1 hypothetical protein C5E45_15755 [Nocardia nova]
MDGRLFGAALQVAEERRMRTRVGLATDQQLAEAPKPLVEPLLADGRYPAFTRWFHGRTGAGSADPVAWTLRCLLDGITARMGLGDPDCR